MKTLIILSHPNIAASRCNKALIEAVQGMPHTTLHDIDAHYGTNTKGFDVAKEQQLLLEHDRIIFQFRCTGMQHPQCSKPIWMKCLHTALPTAAAVTNSTVKNSKRQ